VRGVVRDRVLSGVPGDAAAAIAASRTAGDTTRSVGDAGSTQRAGQMLLATS
jgi:hypothetical protein